MKFKIGPKRREKDICMLHKMQQCVRCSYRVVAVCLGYTQYGLTPIDVLIEVGSTYSNSEEPKKNRSRGLKYKQNTRKKRSGEGHSRLTTQRPSLPSINERHEHANTRTHERTIPCPCSCVTFPKTHNFCGLFSVFFSGMRNAEL